MSKEQELVTKLTKNNYTISTAESCTGGLLAGAIVNVSGASAVFPGGFVTYANEMKNRFAGVSNKTLEQYGAVSEQTAGEMAVGCAKMAGTEVGLSTTGIAGPEGGTSEKPVGLVYIGCAIHGKVTAERHIFKGSRSEVRQQAVEAAIDLAIHLLEQE